MKTIFFILCAVLTAPLLPRFMPYETQASGVLSHAPIEKNKAVEQTEMRSLTNSVDQRTQKPITGNSKVPLPRGVSKQADSIALKNATFLHGADQINQEASTVFQVSPDPRDQVRLSISNKIVTVEGSVRSEELAQKVIKRLAQIPGVREVRNHLAFTDYEDSEIAVEVREAFPAIPPHIAAPSR